MSLINSTAIPSGASAYEIEQSLRFDQNTSTSLSKTPTSAGNRTTWTYSVWMKLGQFGDGWNMIFNAGQSDGGGSAGTRLTGLLMYNSTLYIYWDSASGGTNPAMKLRDNSAWYHVCLVATSSSLACYINGTLAGTKSGSGNGAINNTQAHAIGSRADTANSYFNGLMSEAHFIDGTAKAPTDFAETGDYGEWKPKEYSGSYGTNGFYLNFAGGGIISSATGGNSTGTTGDYKYKTYTSNGTFTPSNDGYVEYLVVGGGGGGGSRLGGGGGGGGFRTGFVQLTGSTAYTVTVGAGGAYDASGNNSSVSGTGITTLTASGGGTGGAGNHVSAGGGSGGGGAGITTGNTNGSAGTSGQGNDGGDGAGSAGFAGGGGGGAGADGADGVQSGKGGNGGAGLQSNIDTNNYYYSGGGGGGAHFAPSTGAGNGGIGGGGGGARGGGSTDGGIHGNGTGGGSARNSGGSPADAVNQLGGNGGANTGGGGGGAPNNVNSGGAGGSGIVIIRYKFQ